MSGCGWIGVGASSMLFAGVSCLVLRALSAPSLVSSGSGLSVSEPHFGEASL